MKTIFVYIFGAGRNYDKLKNLSAKLAPAARRAWAEEHQYKHNYERYRTEDHRQPAELSRYKHADDRSDYEYQIYQVILEAVYQILFVPALLIAHKQIGAAAQIAGAHGGGGGDTVDPAEGLHLQGTDIGDDYVCQHIVRI